MKDAERTSISLLNCLNYLGPRWRRPEQARRPANTPGKKKKGRTVDRIKFGEANWRKQRRHFDPTFLTFFFREKKSCCVRAVFAQIFGRRLWEEGRERVWKRRRRLYKHTFLPPFLSPSKVRNYVWSLSSPSSPSSLVLLPFPHLIAGTKDWGILFFLFLVSFGKLDFRIVVWDLQRKQLNLAFFCLERPRPSGHPICVFTGDNGIILQSSIKQEILWWIGKISLPEIRKRSKRGEKGKLSI